ncbi:hypothetical protein Ahy_A01g004449 isoform A [Arachis hypogaea]|uniref:Uncharacterized protein n=1 Tax=Arachis hypogaea TaxID=3818 RepID=A0A445EW43_ARAHY|nr:hypothetical protein Ahy_A01g004449 isoform A [Arachis hypogaea]
MGAPVSPFFKLNSDGSVTKEGTATCNGIIKDHDIIMNHDDKLLAYAIGTLTITQPFHNGKAKRTAPTHSHHPRPRASPSSHRRRARPSLPSSHRPSTAAVATSSFKATVAASFPSIVLPPFELRNHLRRSHLLPPSRSHCPAGAIEKRKRFLSGFEITGRGKGPRTELSELISRQIETLKTPKYPDNYTKSVIFPHSSLKHRNSSHFLHTAAVLLSRRRLVPVATTDSLRILLPSSVAELLAADLLLTPSLRRNHRFFLVIQVEE